MNGKTSGGRMDNIEIVLKLRSDDAALQENFSHELRLLMSQAMEKALQQLARQPCLCKAAEECDKLRDSNGNVVGTVCLRTY